MKAFLLITVLILCATASKGQNLKKYPIGNSGCSLYTFCDATFEMTWSEDSARIHTGEWRSGDISYGAVCVQLRNAVSNPDDAENLMIAYADYLKGGLNITGSAGYGKGHRLKDMENTRGVLDYWEDKEKNQWKVKAWTDGKFIGILFAYSKKELPETKINVFLDSFRFP